MPVRISTAYAMPQPNAISIKCANEESEDSPVKMVDKSDIGKAAGDIGGQEWMWGDGLRRARIVGLAGLIYDAFQVVGHSFPVFGIAVLLMRHTSHRRS